MTHDYRPNWWRLRLVVVSFDEKVQLAVGFGFDFDFAAVGVGGALWRWWESSLPTCLILTQHIKAQCVVVVVVCLGTSVCCTGS